jgi:hypothetical protein
MKQIEALHRAAMAKLDEAFLLRVQGQLDAARASLRGAFEEERRAALATKASVEPTRSVLLRSAASIAFDLGELREAERLVAIALSGDPPPEIAEELRDLLESVNLGRHLVVRGVQLQPAEFQVSMTGDAVGFGVARSGPFVRRMQSLETLSFRTAERILERPYRDAGRRGKAMNEELEVYLSVPRAASFAISFRLGSSPQLQLPGSPNLAEAVVDEMLSLFGLFDANDSTALAKRIPDPAYLRNFVGLVKTIAPDGRAIRTVGFTAIRHGEARSVQLKSVPPTELSLPLETLPPPLTIPKEQSKVTVLGELRYADDLREGHSSIRLKVSGRRRQYRVLVPEGMMADIVGPIPWGSQVRVTGMQREDGVILLTDIQSAESTG